MNYDLVGLGNALVDNELGSLKWRANNIGSQQDKPFPRIRLANKIKAKQIPLKRLTEPQRIFY